MQAVAMQNTPVSDHNPLSTYADQQYARIRMNVANLSTFLRNSFTSVYLV